MKITDQRTVKDHLIEGGDLILLPDGVTFLVLTATPVDLMCLINMGTGEFYVPGDKYTSVWFKHPAHMRNHLKKHYKSYQHIKNNQVEVTIHDAATHSGF